MIGRFRRWSVSIPRASRVFLVVLAALFVAGCGTAQHDVGTADGKPRVALIMKSLANEFFATMAAGAREHQATHADAYELIVNGIKDERDLARQVALVEEMIAQSVDAIVIAPADSKALVSACRRAQEAGIVVVNIDNKLDDEVLRSQGTIIPFVGPDNRAGARMVGEYLAGRLEAGSPVAIIEGLPTAFNGQQRRLGFEDAMSATGMTVVDAQTAQWEMDQANRIATAMLGEHPEIRALLCANDSMALGALAAVKAAGKVGQVKIVGFDNISAIQSAIRDGSVLATADQHGDQLAVYGIEYALQLLKSDETPADRTTPVDLITAETLD